MKIVASILLFIVPFASFCLGEWELEKDSKGVKVFTRKNANSDIKEFKAICTVYADRLKIAQVVTRVTDYVNWFPHSGESRILEVISSTERKCYYRVDMPWPIDDRDCIMLMKVKVDNTKKITTVYFNDIDQNSEKTDAIRMKDSDGFWIIKTLTSKKCEVTYQFASDPAGSLPAWVVNMFIVDGPYDALIALKEKVE